MRFCGTIYKHGHDIGGGMQILHWQEIMTKEHSRWRESAHYFVHFMSVIDHYSSSQILIISKTMLPPALKLLRKFLIVYTLRFWNSKGKKVCQVSFACLCSTLLLPRRSCLVFFGCNVGNIRGDLCTMSCVYKCQKQVLFHFFQHYIVEQTRIYLN